MQTDNSLRQISSSSNADNQLANSQHPIEKSMVTSNMEDQIEKEIKRRTIVHQKSLIESNEMSLSGVDSENNVEKNSRKSGSNSRIPGSLVSLNQNVTLVKSSNSESKNEGAGRLKTDEYIYSGQWSNNKFNGYGRIVKKLFALYEGIFVDNKRDGFGVEIYVNSDIYIGQFKNDKKHGLGVYFFSNGGYFYGFFEGGFRTGFGTLLNKSNRHAYIGFWKNDQKSGRGLEMYKNGSKYDGYFLLDKRNGVGFMEYSKTLQYLGEWKSGLKHGLGKVEHNKKTISGLFENDNFKESVFYNIMLHTDKLSYERLSPTVEEYLKENSFKLIPPFVKNFGEIYLAVKDSLVVYVLDLVEKGVLRLSTYLKVKSIFSKQSQFEYFVDDIIYLLSNEPNAEKHKFLWDPEQREFLVSKTDYSWDKHKLTIQDSKALFDETQQKDVDIQLEKLGSDTQMVLTNEFIIGNFKDEEFEGVLGDEKFSVKTYNSLTDELNYTQEGTVFPFFVHLKSSEEEFVYTLNYELFTGEFYFEKEQVKPFNISLFLHLDSDGHWYSVGVDSVGVYSLAGKLNKLNSTGQFLQKYVKNYKIQYNISLATHEKLQGTWSTTNLSGNFVLRKDESFNLTEKLKRAFLQIHQIKKEEGEINLSKIEELQSYYSDSILSVIIKNKQGGVPDFIEKKESTENAKEMFERFKKQKTEVMDQEPNKQSINPALFKKETKLSDNDAMSPEEIDDPVEVIDNQNQIKQVNRMSLALLNMKVLETTIKLQEYQSSMAQETIAKVDTGFRKTLYDAIKGLKGQFGKIVESKARFEETTNETISWVGRLTNLGREDTFVFDHLYFISDVIEGILKDSDEVTYEVAGSYLARTGEFEMVGMSIDKRRSIKFKGNFENFMLKANVTRKPNMNTVSQIQIKLFGHSGVAIIKNLADEDLPQDKLSCYVKLTKNFIYGFILFEKEHLVISGVRHPQIGFGIEISCHNKKFKGISLMENKMEENQSEKTLRFTNANYEIVIQLD